MARVSVKIFSVLCGVVGGWASALSFIDSVGSMPAGAAGNWRMWDLASGTSSNPYARAHFLIEGRVPPAQSLFQVYTNSQDDEGSTLSSGCVYKIAATDLESRWWSLSVGPLNNQDKDSSAAVTSDEVVRGADGSLNVAMARSPVTGNWIRPATEGSLTLQLVVSNVDTLQAASELKLPQRAAGELLIMRNLYWVITAAVLAIIVHISTVLFAPSFLFERNLNRLASDVPDNTFFVLPASAQSAIFPEYPSGTVFGLCRFNLTSGPVTLDANLPDGIWTLTVYSRFGRTLYTVTDEQSGVDKFSLQLAMAPGVLDVFSLKEDENEVESSGWKVQSSDERGFAVFWVPALDKAMREGLSEILSKSSCGKATS